MLVAAGDDLVLEEILHANGAVGGTEARRVEDELVVGRADIVEVFGRTAVRAALRLRAVMAAAELDREDVLAELFAESLLDIVPLMGLLLAASVEHRRMVIHAILVTTSVIGVVIIIVAVGTLDISVLLVLAEDVVTHKQFVLGVAIGVLRVVAHGALATHRGVRVSLHLFEAFQDVAGFGGAVDELSGLVGALDEVEGRLAALLVTVLFGSNDAEVVEGALGLDVARLAALIGAALGERALSAVVATHERVDSDMRAIALAPPL